LPRLYRNPNSRRSPERTIAHESFEPRPLLAHTRMIRLGQGCCYCVRKWSRLRYLKYSASVTTGNPAGSCSDSRPGHRSGRHTTCTRTSPNLGDWCRTQCLGSSRPQPVRDSSP
jgi:hypothetical protein